MYFLQPMVTTWKMMEKHFQHLAKEEIANENSAQSLSQRQGADEQGTEEIILPILPLRNTVVFPQLVVPISVGRESSVRLIESAHKQNQHIGVVAQRDPQVDDPTPSDLFGVGTVAEILRVLKMENEGYTVIIRGLRRYRIRRFVQEKPFLLAQVELLKDHPINEEDQRVKALIEMLTEMAIRAIELSPSIPEEAVGAIRNAPNALFLIHLVAGNLEVSIDKKQQLLEEDDPIQRVEGVIKYLSEQLHLLKIRQEIQEKVRQDVEKQQREFLLEQQLKRIQQELGRESPGQIIDDLVERAKQKQWPPTAKAQFDKEVRKLRHMNPAAAEFSVTLNYLELLLDLPWNEYTKDNLDIRMAKRILDRDHYGLEKVKERIIEYLAVLKLRGDMKSPILCLYGPPGVGKTSLGKSIARALNRKYGRISLGGLHDEAEIRGHRRTYIGAMPGRIIQTLRKVGSSNPVIVLDEIDKVGQDFRGDPAAALLELLDPEQNASFYDNYLELEYDLSRVLFIATANTLTTIHPALQDRLEIIPISGYITEEKVEIARRYLLPKQRQMHGVPPKDFILRKPQIRYLIHHYTREAGVRTLEKQIAGLIRHRARQIVENSRFRPIISAAEIDQVLGPPPFVDSTYTRSERSGLVAGLAWTPTGGDVLFIEVALIPGKGKLMLTGRLGEVMQESAQTAFSYLKSHAEEYAIPSDSFAQYDIHIHVPEGAVPKEGPSAGITIFTALVSAFQKRPTSLSVAMTGEITLHGNVLPVGGIRDKVLAARRAEITNIILSKFNRKDVEDISKQYLKGLRFHYVTHAREVLRYALNP